MLAKDLELAAIFWGGLSSNFSWQLEHKLVHNHSPNGCFNLILASGSFT